MSNHEPTSDQKFILTFVVVIAVMALFAIAIFVLAQVLAAQENTRGSAERNSVTQNMAGDAAVWTQDGVAPQPKGKEKPRKTTDKIVRSCGSCHVGGTGGAPKFNDKDAWAVRLQARGLDGLVKNAINGLNEGMPARGNQDIDDEQVRAAVTKILTDAGALPQ